MNLTPFFATPFFAPTAERPSRRSSKPRPAASRPFVRRTARRVANLLAINEPDPVLTINLTPFLSTPFLSSKKEFVQREQR